MSVSREELRDLLRIRKGLRDAGYHVCKVEKRMGTNNIIIHAIGYSPEPCDRVIDELEKELEII